MHIALLAKRKRRRGSKKKTDETEMWNWPVRTVQVISNYWLISGGAINTQADDIWINYYVIHLAPKLYEVVN